MHERYMRRAIELALRAEGQTSPNPLVGACVVKGGRIVGEGLHKMAGLPHAEVNALNAAGQKAKGASLYVTLEPCDHFGRTPPCTEAIIRSGIKEVIIAMRDPNPINNGRGIRRLKKSGIKTVQGVLEDKAKAMNRPYIKFITKGLPYVTLKLAESLDGKIATSRGDSKWITGEEARRRVQFLRGRVDAVMVGVNTIIKDDPRLTLRVGKKKLTRIILDSRLRTPLDARIFADSERSPIVIAAAEGANQNKARALEKRGALVLSVKSRRDKVDIVQLLKILAEMGMMHILVEGGGELAASLIENGLADHLLFFIAPKIIGGRDAVTSVEGDGVDLVSGAVRVKGIKLRRFGEDILVEGDIACSRA